MRRNAAGSLEYKVTFDGYKKSCPQWVRANANRLRERSSDTALQEHHQEVLFDGNTTGWLGHDEWEVEELTGKTSSAFASPGHSVSPKARGKGMAPEAGPRHGVTASSVLHSRLRRDT